MSRQKQHVLYPNHYLWLVFVGMLDVIMTTVIIGQLGGHEVNPVAQWFIDLCDVWGLLMLKCSTLILVVTCCETIGRTQPTTARRLARAGIAISAAPVVIALYLAATV
ncbi:MAG: DUF5658 family protein [Planctomycetota bacterium]